MNERQLKKAVAIHLTAVCHDCRRRHDFTATAASMMGELDRWHVKHPGHQIEFTSRKRSIFAGLKDRWLYPAMDRFGLIPWWLEYEPNADFKIAYASSAAYTITLASLATSSDFTAGRESSAVDNTSNKYLDYLVGGKITTGTSPTSAKSIRVFAYGSVDDSPTYPDVLDGTDSAETITSVDILNQMPMLAGLGVNNTSDRAYWMWPRSLGLAFGGVIPKFHGLYVAHDTAVNLNSTGGNHVLSHTGSYITG